MKITSTKLMKRLSNTGVKVLYTRKNGEKRVGQFVTGRFIDGLGKKYYSNLAFVYDIPVGKSTFVSKDLHEKDFEVMTIVNDKKSLENLAINYPNNVVLFETKQGNFVTGTIARGKITTCLGDVYEKNLAFVSFKPFGENCKKDINSKEIWKRNIILIDTNAELAPKTIDVQAVKDYKSDFENIFEPFIKHLKDGHRKMIEKEKAREREKENARRHMNFRRLATGEIVEDKLMELTDKDIAEFVELMFKTLL